MTIDFRLGAGPLHSISGMAGKYEVKVRLTGDIALWTMTDGPR
jgi:hypothetical protein